MNEMMTVKRGTRETWEMKSKTKGNWKNNNKEVVKNGIATGVFFNDRRGDERKKIVLKHWSASRKRDEERSM